MQPLAAALTTAVLIASAAIAAVPAPAIAQSGKTCPHYEGERDRITRTLQAAPTCQSAYETMNACRSNSSGDVELAEVVIGRCESVFLAGLSNAAKRSYEQEREACRRRYAKQQGTMYVSFAVTCEAGVAARMAGAAERRSRSR